MLEVVGIVIIVDVVECIELVGMELVIIMDVLVCIELVDMELFIIMDELVCTELDIIHVSHIGDEVLMLEDEAMLVCIELDDIDVAQTIIAEDDVILGAFGAALVGIISGAAVEEDPGHPFQPP